MSATAAALLLLAALPGQQQQAVADSAAQPARNARRHVAPQARLSSATSTANPGAGAVAGDRDRRRAGGHARVAARAHANLAAVASPFIFSGRDAVHLAVRRALHSASPAQLRRTMARHRARYLLVDRATIPAGQLDPRRWSRLREVDRQGTLRLYELVSSTNGQGVW